MQILPNPTPQMCEFPLRCLDYERIATRFLATTVGTLYQSTMLLVK